MILEKKLFRSYGLLIGFFMGLKNAFIALAKGVATFKRVSFVNYPFEKYQYSDRFKGHPQLTTQNNGTLNCKACKLCQQICPAKCINVVKEKGQDIPRKFELDISHCAFCNLCVEVCPHNAIIMSDDYAISGLSEREWVLGVRQLTKRRFTGK